MSSFSQAVKNAKAKDIAFFFGEVKRISNQYFTFNHVVDDDNIIVNVASNQIRIIKGNPVLLVGNSHAVYLKDWQIKRAHNYGDICQNFEVVKLNRKFFKVYTFRTEFDDVDFDEVQSFDDLRDIAKAQDVAGMPVALGYMN